MEVIMFYHYTSNGFGGHEPAGKIQDELLISVLESYNNAFDSCEYAGSRLSQYEDASVDPTRSEKSRRRSAQKAEQWSGKESFALGQMDALARVVELMGYQIVYEDDCREKAVGVSNEIVTGWADLSAQDAN